MALPKCAKIVPLLVMSACSRDQTTPPKPRPPPEHLSCPEPGRIDRIYFRSSATVTVEALIWKVDDRYVDSAGKALSDHEAVAAQLRVRAAP